MSANIIMLDGSHYEVIILNEFEFYDTQSLSETELNVRGKSIKLTNRSMAGQVEILADMKLNS